MSVARFRRIRWNRIGWLDGEHGLEWLDGENQPALLDGEKRPELLDDEYRLELTRDDDRLGLLARPRRRRRRLSVPMLLAFITVVSSAALVASQFLEW